MKKRSGIAKQLTHMTILPLVIISIVTLFISILCISTSMANEVHTELKNLAKGAVMNFDTIYPGDYQSFTKDNKILITKGDTILNFNYEYLDSLKEATGVDYSLFYGDLRVSTTLCNDADIRLADMKAGYQIVKDVISSNESAFYQNVSINGSSYYCYYEPIRDSNAKCIGMFATATPSKRVWRLIFQAVLPVIAIFAIAILLVWFWSRARSKEFIRAIQQLDITFSKTARGELSNTVPPELLARKDEFGEISHSVLDMQKSLRTLVERDALTGLFNRRFGQQRLDKMYDKTLGSTACFSVALGDIDFFKKFNDTYGHDCGDLVLQEVAKLLQEYTKDYGYAIRWGGEEFLIVFSNGEYSQHKKAMENLLDAIRTHSLLYQEQELHITMTFGLVTSEEYPSSNELVKKVDDLLYFGKENGRNQLVTSEDSDQ